MNDDVQVVIVDDSRSMKRAKVLKDAALSAKRKGDGGSLSPTTDASASKRRATTKSQRPGASSSSVKGEGGAWQPLDDLALINCMVKGSTFKVASTSNLFSRQFTLEQVEERWKALLYTDISEKKHAGVAREANGILFGGGKEPEVSEQEDEVLRQEQVAASGDDAMQRLLVRRRADFAFKRTPKTLGKHYRSLIKNGAFDRFSHPFLTDVRLDAQTSEHPLTEPPDYQVLGSSDSKPIIKTTAPPSHSDLLSYKGIERVDPALLIQDDLSSVPFEKMDIQVLSFADASLFAPLTSVNQWNAVVKEESRNLMRLISQESKVCSTMSDDTLALLYGEGNMAVALRCSPCYLSYCKGALVQVDTLERCSLVIEQLPSKRFQLTCKSDLSLVINGCSIRRGASTPLHNLCFVQLPHMAYLFEINHKYGAPRQ